MVVLGLMRMRTSNPSMPGWQRGSCLLLMTLLPGSLRERMTSMVLGTVACRSRLCLPPSMAPNHCMACLGM